jgi:prepilin-type N-terminal cleavage/methylation domain-containing protein
MRRGFTLIELLIVVVIIAIPAAAAVANLFEAQTRVKVARSQGKDTESARQTREFLRASSAELKVHAQELLKMLDRDGRLPTEYPYPLQVWQFGPDLTLIAMSGEPVVDYALRLKKELGADSLWVAGYSNDAFAYIPSLRVQHEGGYEGGGATVGARLPGPFAPSIEETIVRKVHELIERTRVQ